MVRDGVSGGVARQLATIPGLTERLWTNRLGELECVPDIRNAVAVAVSDLLDVKRGRRKLEGWRCAGALAGTGGREGDKGSSRPYGN